MKLRDIPKGIYDPFRPALKRLKFFGHIIVFWWADRRDNRESSSIMQTDPPYAGGKVTGVFACRAEHRPNPIVMTVCKLLALDEGHSTVQVANIDAYDGPPVVDLKAYFRVRTGQRGPHFCVAGGLAGMAAGGGFGA